MNAEFVWGIFSSHYFSALFTFLFIAWIVKDYKKDFMSKVDDGIRELKKTAHEDRTRHQDDIKSQNERIMIQEQQIKELYRMIYEMLNKR